MLLFFKPGRIRWVQNDRENSFQSRRVHFAQHNHKSTGLHNTPPRPAAKGEDEGRRTKVRTKEKGRKDEGRKDERIKGRKDKRT